MTKGVRLAIGMAIAWFSQSVGSEVALSEAYAAVASDADHDRRAIAQVRKAREDVESGASPEAPETPYNEAQQKSVHNAYAAHEPLFDQLAWHKVRSVEIDVHLGKTGRAPVARDWYVYHADAPFMRGTNCTMLSDCLGQIAAFHRAVPNHDVVTLFIDLKDGFTRDHAPADLDAVVARTLGRDALVTPRDLVERCSGARSLRAAVTDECRFPSLAALRSKFFVVLTGGTACDPTSHVSAYLDAEPTTRFGFAAPNTDASCPVDAYRDKRSVVFLNMRYEERRHAIEARKRGFVARIYSGGLRGGLNDPNAWLEAKNTGAQLLATDRVSATRDPWASTRGKRGFPFACSGCDAAPTRTDGEDAIFGMRAVGQDVWGTADSFYFAYERETADETLSGFLSVPSSHVESWAKGCLMARESTRPGSANVAVCRPFDRHPPRMQVRRTEGGETVAIPLVIPPISHTSDETPAFLRLSVQKTAHGSEATAWASTDGTTWREIGRASVAAALPLRGLAVASHGTAPVRGIFGALTKTTVFGSAPFGAASLALREGIGASAYGAIDAAP